MSIFSILKRKKTKKSVKATTKYLVQKEITRKFVKERLEFYQNIYAYHGYDLKFKRIAIRDQKTRWGSCSSKSNLNFNYKLTLIPEYLADYVIVHELCHLKEMNHAKSFWDLVSIVMPNYLELREELRKVNLRKL